jgi:hypothetical protein
MVVTFRSYVAFYIRYVIAQRSRDRYLLLLGEFPESIHYLLVMLNPYKLPEPGTNKMHS